MTTRPTHRGEVQPIVAVVLGVAAIVGIVGAVLVARPAVAGPAGPSAPAPSAPAPSTSADPGRGSSPSPSGPANPSAAPTVDPTAVPTTLPTAQPSTGPVAIKLQNATNHDVSLKIQNPNAVLTDARSGKPGDGMSVRWHDSIVVNLDDDTVEVVFVGLPQDEIVDLVVNDIGDGIHLTLVQTGPMPMSDAMGEDRVLVLSFARPIAAHDVTVEILDRTID